MGWEPHNSGHKGKILWNRPVKMSDQRLTKRYLTGITEIGIPG